MVVNKYKYIVIFLFLLLCSCQQYPIEDNHELIIGEWRPVVEKGHWYDVYRGGYTFMDNGLCDDKLGFFSYFYPKRVQLHTPGVYCMEMDLKVPYYIQLNTELNNVIRFYGNRTSYKITGDTLKIYDPSKNTWLDRQIYFESPDTMVLSYVNECSEPYKIRFSRVIYRSDNQSGFEQLIFYLPYGILGDRVFSIQRDGTFLSYGYKGKRQFFAGKMRKGEFERIESLFKNVNFSNINSDHKHGYYTFQPEIIIIQKNEVKIIPGMTVTTDNKEFFWAYISTLFSPGSINMQPLDLKEYVSNDLIDIQSDIRFYIDFVDEENKDDLSLERFSPSEKFYLIQLLVTADETTRNFTPKHKVVLYYNEQREEVDTDGRYYRFTDKFGNKRTLDIGVNFFEDINFFRINTYEQYGVSD